MMTSPTYATRYGSFTAGNPMSRIVAAMRRLPYQAKQLILVCIDLFILMGSGLLAAQLIAGGSQPDLIWLLCSALLGGAALRLFKVYRAGVSGSDPLALW